MKKTITSTVTAVFCIIFMSMPIIAQASSYTTYKVECDGAVIFDSRTVAGDFTVPEEFMENDIVGIAMGAFEGSDITNITFNKKINRIETGAFRNCKNLLKAAIPEGVMIIEPSTFYGCEAMTQIDFPQNLMGIGNSAFYNTKLRSVVIPYGTQVIDYSAFAECHELSDITIPVTVEYIGETVFEGCDKLTIHCLKDSAAHKYAVENDISFILE